MKKAADEEAGTSASTSDGNDLDKNGGGGGGATPNSNNFNNSEAQKVGWSLSRGLPLRIFAYAGQSAYAMIYEWTVQQKIQI